MRLGKGRPRTTSPGSTRRVSRRGMLGEHRVTCSVPVDNVGWLTLLTVMPFVIKFKKANSPIVFARFDGQVGKILSRKSPNCLEFHRTTSVLLMSTRPRRYIRSPKNNTFCLSTTSLIYLLEKSNLSCRICRLLIVSPLPIDSSQNHNHFHLVSEFQSI